MEDGLSVDVGPEAREGPVEVEHLLKGDEVPVHVTHDVLDEHFFVNPVDISLNPGDDGIHHLVLGFNPQVSVIED